MPENLVPVGWKVHIAQDGHLYKCPKCYEQEVRDINPRELEQLLYIEIHHPEEFGRVESNFVEGGIPTNIAQRMRNMILDGGKRKRRKKSTKKKGGRKRGRTRRKKRGKKRGKL